MKRIAKTLLAATAVSLMALMALVPAQLSAAKTFTISVTQIVEHPSLDAVRKGFEDRMKELGVEAQYKVHIAQGKMDTANQIAAQMLGEKPDLILAIATPTAIAAAQKIKEIPILFTAITDPVEAKLVPSLAAPGGNISGMTDRSPVDRQLALIKEVVPATKTLGVIYNSGEANSVSTLEKQVKPEAAKLGWKVEAVTAANSAAVVPAAKSLVGKVDAIYIPTDNTVITALEAILKIAAEAKIPTFSADTDSVKRGTIAAVAVDYYKMGRQTADMGKRILVGGEKTATMPVEDLKDLELHVNPKAAAAMGVTLPQSVLGRASKVLE